MTDRESAEVLLPKRAALRLQLLRTGCCLLGMLALSALVYFTNIPNPNMILVAALVAVTSCFGYIPGVVCGLEMIGYSMFFFSTDHTFFAYTEINLQKVLVVALGVTLTVLFIGRLKRRHNQTLLQTVRTTEELRQEKQLLEEASMTDALTGVHNRYAYYRNQTKFERKYLHVMMIDLDRFKQTNDTYGHEAGDELLRCIGAALKETFGMECCFRYGGDEFLVICPGVPELLFQERMSRIRGRYRTVTVGSTEIPLCFSAGYVYGDSMQDGDLSRMVRQADDLMYREKRRKAGFCCGEPYKRGEE